MNQDTEDQYRKIASSLEEVANRIENGSDEERAVKKAGWALAYIFTSNQWQRFEDFVVENTTPPTEDEIHRMNEHLRSIGIDPDSPLSSP